MPHILLFRQTKALNQSGNTQNICRR